MKGGWKGAIWTGYTDEEGNPDPWLSFPAYTLGAFAKGAVSGTPTIGEEPLKDDVSPHILYATPTTSSSKSEALINSFCEYTQTSNGDHQAGDPCAIDSDTSADDWTFNWESYTGGQVFQITIKNPAGQNAYEYNTVLLNASSQDLEVNLKEQDSGTGPTVNLNAHSVSSVQWTP